MFDTIIYTLTIIVIVVVLYMGYKLLERKAENDKEMEKRADLRIKDTERDRKIANLENQVPRYPRDKKGRFTSKSAWLKAETLKIVKSIHNDQKDH